MAEIKPETKTEISTAALSSLTFGVLLRPAAPVESPAAKAMEEKSPLVGASSADATKEATSSSKPPATDKAAEPVEKAPVANRRREFRGWEETKLPEAVPQQRRSPEEKAVQHQEGDKKQAAKETLEIVKRGFVVGKVLGEAPPDTLPGVTVAMLRIQTLEPTPREFLISKGGAKRVEVFDDGVNRKRCRLVDPVDEKELKALHDLVRGEGKIVVVRGTAIELFKESEGWSRPEWSVPSYFPEDAQAEIKKIVDGAEKK